MIVFSLMVMLFFMFFSYITEKNFFNPIMIFNGAFCILISFYSLRLFGIYDVDTIVFDYILVGILFFNFGTIFVRIVSRNVSGNIGSSSMYQFKNLEAKKWNHIYNILIKCVIISIIIEFIYAIPSIGYLLQGNSLYTLRYVASDSLNAVRSTLIVILHSYFAIPFLFISLPVSCIEFISERKKKLLLLTIFLDILFFLAYGERMAFVYPIICIISSLLILNNGKRNVIDKKQKKKIIIIFLIIIFVIYLSTVLRSSGSNQQSESFFASMYRYIVGTLPNFSQKLNDSRIVPLEGIGQVTFYGVYNIFNTVYEIVFHNTLKFFSNGQILWDLIRGGNVFIDNSGKLYNFCTTGFIYFYADYGVVGIGGFSALFGMISEYFYLKVLKKQTMFNMMIYLCIMQSLAMFILYNMYSNVQFVLAIVYIILFFNGKFKMKTYLANSNKSNLYKGAKYENKNHKI